MWETVLFLGFLYGVTSLAAGLFFLLVRPQRCDLCTRCVCKAAGQGALWLPLLVYWLVLAFFPGTWSGHKHKDAHLWLRQ